MMTITLPEKWKWLVQPLGRTMRARLELCLGVVVTTAAIVGLSTVIRPDPSKLASKLTVTPGPSRGERRAEADLRPEAPARPKVSPDFAHAVARGDLDAMAKHHVPGVLEGMLALAAQEGQKRSVVWLLEHDADVHEAELTTDAPVLAGDGHPEIVELLLQRGAKEPPLEAAAGANAKNAVLRDLAAHAAVNPPDASPLTSAVSSGRGDAEIKLFIVEKLLAAGADPNRDVGGNPLASAVQTCEERSEERPSAYGCMPLIKLLLKNGARTTGDALVNAFNLDEATRSAPLEALLGARLVPGATATVLAQATNVTPREVKLLTAKGIDWAWHDGEDDAALPLLAAVQRSDRDAVRTLLEAGAPADARYKDATSALGVAIDSTAGGGSPPGERIVELLVARGVDVNRRLPDGRTPLFAAAEAGDLRVVIALLERGARVNDVILDDTALDVAERNDHQPVARLLHSRGGRRARKPGGFPGSAPY